MSPHKRITLPILIVVMAYGLSMCSDHTEPSDPIQKIEKVIAGKNVVVLNFWSIFCLPCLKELPVIASLDEEYKNDKNISINTIALNSENELKQFFSVDTANTYGNIYKRLNLKISFPIIAFNKYNSNFIPNLNAVSPNDQNDRLLLPLYAKFNLSGIPTTIIFFKGKEYRRFIGFEGDDSQFREKIEKILIQLKKRL